MYNVYINIISRKVDVKMKAKRFLSAAVAAMLVLSMAACGNKGNSSGSSESSSSDDSSSVVYEKVDRGEITETVGDLDYSDYQPDVGVAADFHFETEAEDCVISGNNAVTLSDDGMGAFSGSGYVGKINGGAIRFKFNSETDGRYDAVITAAKVDTGAAAVFKFDVDSGATREQFSIPENEQFVEITIPNVYMAAGEHVISIEDTVGSLYVDKIEFKASQGVDLSMYSVSHKLSNPNANDTTQRLYNFLVDIYGKYTLTGQYADSNNYPLEDNMLYSQDRAFSQIQANCGDLPAVLGLDLMECSPSRVAHGSAEGDKFYTAARAWDAKNGIVTLSWHWNAPDPYLGVNGEPWYRGFYSDATNFDLKAAIEKTDQEGYDYLISDIDAIAAELQKLEDADIPVLWRPLHEAGGDYRYNNTWFWWGAAGSEAYKELWKLMYDRLTNYWGLDNLIWVWNGQRTDWYPGDEYVDIIGYDFYAEAFDYSSQEEIFDYIRKSTSTNKIITLSENGVVYDVDDSFNSGVRWSWFATWSGEYAVKDFQLSQEYTDLEHWQKTYSSDRALTLSELPDWHCYPLEYEDK